MKNPVELGKLLTNTPFFDRQEIDAVDRPPLPTCIYTSVIEDSGHVQELRLGFVQTVYLDEEDTPMSTNYYVFADILPALRQLVVWVPSSSQVYVTENLSERVSPDVVARRYASQVCLHLSAELDMELDIPRSVAFLIWKRNTATPPSIQRRLQGIAELTQSYIDDVATFLELDTLDTDLVFRSLQCLWEGALALQENIDYQGEDIDPDSRDGFVTGNVFGDRAGAVGQTMSTHPVENTELHFSTRPLVETSGRERFDRVDFAWYNNSPSHIIRSSIKAFPGYLRIRFRAIHSEEEIRNVLSKIGVYWREAWASERDDSQSGSVAVDAT